MARNKLQDLNNHLFAQLERLSEEDIPEEELLKEIQRAKAMNEVAKNIITNATVTLAIVRYVNEEVDKNKPLPEQFEALRGSLPSLKL